MVGVENEITRFDLYGTGNVEAFYKLYRPYTNQDPNRKALTRLWQLGEWTYPQSGRV